MIAKKRTVMALILALAITPLIASLAGGASTQTIVAGNNKAVVMLPFFHQTGRSNRIVGVDLKAAGYDDPVVLKDTSVDIEAYKRLSRYSAIFIQTHGMASPNFPLFWRSTGYIATDQKYTPEIQRAYASDFDAGRMVDGTTPDGNHVVNVSADWLVRTNGDFPDSLLYLFSCDVMNDGNFGKILNKRNVQAVVGFDWLASSWDPETGKTEDQMTLEDIKATSANDIADDRETQGFFDTIAGGVSVEDSFGEVFKKTPGTKAVEQGNTGKSKNENDGPPCNGWRLSTAYDTGTTSFLLNQPQKQALAGSDTAFVLDVSGSMEGQKIADLKSAATDLVNMIQNEANSSGINHQVGLVTFTTDSKVLSEITDGFDAVKTKINGLTSQDSTNMEAGVRDGTAILTANPPGRKRIMILLSDGVPNVGASTRDELLNGVVKDAKAAGITIYTVGFGSRGSSDDIDEGLLRAIASDTSGTYKYAANGFDLSSAYLMMRHEATGQVIYDQKGSVNGSQSSSLKGSFDVGQGQGELNGTLNWSGGRGLEFQALDPDGVAVDSSYTGAQMMTDQNGFTQYIIQNPKSGKWKVVVRPGKAGTGGSSKTEYLVVFSTKGGKTPIKTYRVVLAIVCGAALLLALLAFLLLNRRFSLT